MSTTKEAQKTVAIIGGSGKSGRAVVRRAFEAGHRTRLLLRNPDNFELPDARIEVLKGDVRDYPSIRALLHGCDAVLSTLRERKGEPAVRSLAAGHVLRAMQELGVRRFILTCGAAVDAPGDHKDFRTTVLTKLVQWVAPGVAADQQNILELLAKSDVEWTLVRLPTIVDQPATGTVKVSLENLPGTRISAGDLADFLVAQISDPKYVRKTPFIANS